MIITSFCVFFYKYLLWYVQHNFTIQEIFKIFKQPQMQFLIKWKRVLYSLKFDPNLIVGQSYGAAATNLTNDTIFIVFNFFPLLKDLRTSSYICCKRIKINKTKHIKNILLKKFIFFLKHFIFPWKFVTQKYFFCSIDHTSFKFFL